MPSSLQLKNSLSGTTADCFWRDRKTLLLLAALLLASFLVFLPSLNNGFVNWDDQANIYNNPQLTSIDGLQSFFVSIKEIFSNHLYGNYNPLALASFAVEALIFGLDSPSWFHLNNILLHLLCVLLVFRIVLALELKPLPAFFCALLFGIQPMLIESVVWVTERKDVLYGFFYLLAFYSYIKTVKGDSARKSNTIILISFVLALLSKIQAVALPLAMLLVDYYFGRKPGLKLVLEKWHYFALSLLTGLVGIYFLRVDGGIQNNNLFSFFERLLIGAYSYVVYLIKSLVPYRMVPVYPYPAALDWQFYASLAVAVGVLALIGFALLKRWTTVAFGLLFFTVNIMFMLQILGAGQGFIADRFSYIAYFGLFFLYAWGLQRFLNVFPRFRTVAVVALLLLSAGYGYLSFQQSKIWQNGETLWNHVLKYYPSSSLVWENRGDYYREQRRVAEAINDFSHALSLKPDNPLAYASRGQLYLDSTEQKNLPLALADFNRALQLEPDNGNYLLQRGKTYLQLNQPRPAIEDFQAAERLSPNSPELYYERAQAYFRLKLFAEAGNDLEHYLALLPNNHAMWSNLGTVKRLNKQYQASLQAFNRALELAPEQLAYRYKRTLTYYEMGNREQARRELAALRTDGYSGINPAFEQLVRQSD